MFWEKLFGRRQRGVAAEETKKSIRADRRRDPRIEEKREILMEVLEPEAREKKQGEMPVKSLDISVGGMRLESSLELNPESLVRLRLPSDQAGKWIQLIGRIRWIKKVETEKIIELGLEFLDTPPETILDLIDHIYRRPS